MPRSAIEEDNKNPDFESFRENLLVKRRELINLYRHDVKVGQESTDDNSDDFADRANNSYNRELMFSLSDGERLVLIEIESAFQRLDAGSYGECDHCHQAIGIPRLEAVPWAKYCVHCQELEESGLLEG